MGKFSINEVIELAVQIEKKGYTFYNKALERKNLSSNSTELLEKLRDDEIIHEQTFKRMRTELDQEEITLSGDWQEVSNYLRTISDSHIFNKPNAAIKLATSSEDEKELIENAIQFEKDTLLFFNSIYEKIEDQAVRKILKKIIEEEVLHVKKLKNFLLISDV
ncbi:MAG: ferritin family protein [Candidatus Cloacimonetes bacterium]|nr:ferritin family protein [Candidatus Cloacimonadota bacterium]MBL7149308.1 ferritin family protein [Candidatus Cloacimonadota bacterium]